LALALSLVLAIPAPAAASPLPLPFAAGAVVALQGTPHLWVADEQGVLHWSGDTRGLVAAGRPVDWNNPVTVTVDQLRSYQRGDPWLSAGLLKDGDPIYHVKWETDWSTPKLLHIRSIADVELFGINATNYGRFILDRAVWEQRYGISAAALPREPLAPADTSIVPVNQPVRVMRVESRNTAAFDAYWANVDLQVTAVERTQDGSLIWRFSLGNRNQHDTFGIYTTGTSYRYIVAANGARYDAPRSLIDARAGPGGRAEFSLAFSAPTTAGATYTLFLRTWVQGPGFQTTVVWEPMTVILP
jgi:hypothetical protein